MNTSNLSVANSATISRANFRIVRTIEKEYTATYFLGMGGVSKEKELRSAISDMTRELRPNQALAYINVVESTEIPIIPLIFTQTTYVSATVIEYTD